MKLLRRILIAIVLILAALSWIVPAGVLYFARTAPAVARVVPRDLKDVSTSPTPGKSLSYFGYEFELPWNDLDESQTQVSEKSNLNTVWLCFRSGLKLFIVMTPPEAEAPDYPSLHRIYEVTPETIHYWSLIQGWGYREVLFLQLKSILLDEVGNPHGGSSPAETGIFNLQSPGYSGFQYGDPRSRPNTLELRLYSQDGRVEIKFLQAGYDEPSGVTQPEINRIVRSLHRTTANDSPKTLAATSP